jgi:uncharacterized protein (TIGR03382 family)
MTPTAGATTVPSNLPGIFWRPLGSYVNGDATDPTLVMLTSSAAPSTPIPFTTTALTNGDLLIVPTQPLAAGATYTVTDSNTCEGGFGGPGPTTTFTTGASEPLPTELGTLEVVSDARGTIEVATADGGCSTDVSAHHINITPTLSSGATAWASAFHYETYVDDVLWVRKTSINVQVGTSGTWRLYRICEVAGVDAGYQGTPSLPGLSSGVHTVRVKATIPGSSVELWTDPLTVVMSCPGEGVDVNGDGDGDDEAGGCNATGGSASWLLLLLALGYSARRKRQR